MLIFLVSAYSQDVLRIASAGRLDLLELLHDVAEHGALGAPRGPHLLLELLLVVGGARRAHHHDLELLVVVDAGDHVIRPQHVLIEQIADGQVIRIVADRHHRDDFLIVQEQRQRPLVHDGGLDGSTLVIDPRHRLGQARIVGIGAQQELVHRRVMCGLKARGQAGRPDASAARAIRYGVRPPQPLERAAITSRALRNSWTRTSRVAAYWSRSLNALDCRLATRLVHAAPAGDQSGAGLLELRLDL